jgi:hypothetical protein
MSELGNKDQVNNNNNNNNNMESIITNLKNHPQQ